MSEPITIKELQNMKEDTEKQIKDALQNFTKCTGLSVADIHFNTLTMISGESEIIAVELEVRL